MLYADEHSDTMISVMTYPIELTSTIVNGRVLVKYRGTNRNAGWLSIAGLEPYLHGCELVRDQEEQ